MHWTGGWEVRRAKRGTLVLVLGLSLSAHLALALARPTHHVITAAPAAMCDEPVLSVAVPAPSDTTRPDRWKRRSIGGCRGVARCVGPRRAPEPDATQASTAAALQIGDDHAARTVLERAPDAAWVAAAPPASAETLAWPVDEGHFGRGTGLVRTGRLRKLPHEGVDVVAPAGSRAHAVMDGLVIYADNGIRGYGNLVVLVHADATATLYAHLEEAWVVPGDTVRRGQTIGLVGATGLARGPHLHFELRHEGRYRNPLPQFDHIVHRAR